MWFIGLLIGLVLGAIFEGDDGAFVGAALGAALGTIISLLKRKSVAPELAARVSDLESAVRALQQQLAGSPVARTDVAEGVAESAHAPTVATEDFSPARAPVEPEPVPTQVSPSPAAAPAAPATGATWMPEIPEAFHKFWGWLSGGNALVRVGVVVLFFGVAFLLKYAYEHTHVPVELRLTGVALGACAMLIIGWRLRLRKQVYALAMQGGGVGVLYLTVFGAFRMFDLLPAEIAFVLLLVIAVISAFLAIVQNAMSLAVLAISGGFLAPVLASTGSGSHVMLFSYYAVLNLGIFAIALYKAWRPLNVLGFVFTFGIGTMWGARFYRDDMFSSVEPFLLLFFAMYVAIAVIFALRQAPRLKHYVDATLLFGTPIVGFGLQVRLVNPFQYGAAFSALAMAAIYLGLAAMLYRRHQEALRMLVEAFLALGVIFMTLAIPLALDGRWTSAAWALEGAAAYWVGVRQSRRAPRVFGLLMQFGAGVAFLGDMRSAVSDIPVFNSFYLGTIFIALAALFSNRTIERHSRNVDYTAMQASIGVFVWGLAWWVLGGLHEIEAHVPQGERTSVALLFFAGSCTAFSALFGRGWWIARFPALALAPIMALVLATSIFEAGQVHPLAGSGLLAWPVAFAVHFLILRRDDRVRAEYPDRGIPEYGYLAYAHAAGVWLLAFSAAWEIAWQIDQIVDGQHVWPLIGWVLAPVILLNAGASKPLRALWPMQQHSRAYLWLGAVPLAVFLYLWSLYANGSSNADPAPLPYLPFINPLDIAQMLIFATFISWWRSLGESGIDTASQLSAKLMWRVLGALVFIWLNCVLLRSLHHWGGMPYNFGSVIRSDLAQAALSIFWSVLALAAMVFATWRAHRWLWITGAALMALVVLKLFVVDLASVGGIERIVLFIAVGVLMLVIGYFAPVPPRNMSLPMPEKA
jgi:uncharacterized membrane protein